MENQQIKKSSVNFFKDNITKKLKLIIDNPDFEFTQHLKTIANKVKANQKLDTAEFETIGNIAYFIGTDILSMEYLCKETIENMRKRFSEFNITGEDILFLNDIFTNITVSMFEDAKEGMKKLIDSEIVCSNKIVLGQIISRIKNNLKKNEFPVSFARDVEQICSKSVLCYNDLLKFNSLINQQYIIHGENLQSLAKLYSDKDYNNMMEVALYYFDLQKFAVVYLDNIISINEKMKTMLIDKPANTIIDFLNDEIFNQYSFEFETFENVRKYIEQKENEEQIKSVVKEDEITENDEDEENRVNNMFQCPDLFIKNVFEEIADTKIDTEEKLIKTIASILASEEQTSHIYQYMGKYDNFEKRLSFNEVYPNIEAKNIIASIDKCIIEEKEKYKVIVEKLVQEIPTDNINRIVTYVNDCIEELCIKSAEDKGYLMTQLIENQISTWKHLQQLIGLIEAQNILGSGFMTYCILANYLETKTDAKQIFKEGNELESKHIYISYYMMVKKFLFPEIKSENEEK